MAGSVYMELSISLRPNERFGRETATAASRDRGSSAAEVWLDG